MKSFCRKCSKRIKRGLVCMFCGRPICFTCECDCPRVLEILARLKSGDALLSGGAPTETALEAEQAVYHAYVAARELQAAPTMNLADGQKLMATVVDGLKAARRFIFDSYQQSGGAPHGR